MEKLVVDANSVCDRRRFGRASVTLGLIGYLSLIALLVIDYLMSVLFSLELPGAFLYFEMIFGTLCVMLAAFLLRVVWWQRLVAAVLALMLFMLEFIVLGAVCIEMFGLEGIQ